MNASCLVFLYFWKVKATSVLEHRNDTETDANSRGIIVFVALTLVVLRDTRFRRRSWTDLT